MSERRRAIREAVRGHLLNATNAGANVYSNLSTRHWREDLPQIAIYTRSEEIEIFSESPREYKRTIELAVEIIAQGNELPNESDGETCENQLDAIAEQVEDILEANETLGDIEIEDGSSCKIADELRLNNIEFDFTGEGEQPTGSVRLVYNVVYFEYRPLNSQLDDFSDFEQINTEWDIQPEPSGTPDIEAEDEIAIPQS